MAPHRQCLSEPAHKGYIADMRWPVSLAPFALIAVLAGCSSAPDLDARVGPADLSAPPPRLTALGPILAAADAQSSAPAPVNSMAARIAALNARAAALRGPVLDRATSDRISAAIR